ncbi:MAG: hypothetical protein JJ922_15035, partial [Parvibaculum sp.]|uniref:hypothetical protein n=3 Tax=Parvibaculum sp. TaxID=2024848 RepID=UPI001B1DE3BB
MYLRLSVGDIVSCLKGDYELKQVMPDGHLVLQKQFGHESIFMSQDELLKQHAERQLKVSRRIDYWRDRAASLKAYTPRDPNVELGPKAKIRQILLVQYDKSPVALSDKSLKAFIRDADLPKELEAAGWRPSAGTFRRDIRNRTENGLRPLAIMGRRRKRSSSVRMSQEVDPPPLNGSTLKYGFDHEGGPQWQTSDTSPTRSSRSFGRLRFCAAKA